MKNILNNKVLPILLIFLIIIFSVVSNCFASFDVNYNTSVETYPDFTISNNFFIMHTMGADISTDTLVAFDNSLTANDFCVINGRLTPKENAVGCYIQLFKVNNDHTAWEPRADSGTIISTYAQEIRYITFSTFDLLDTNGNVVFQGAPLTPQITGLVQVVEQEVTQETLLAQIKTFLIYLLIFLISMIAIYKAINLLRNAIRTS